MSLSYTSKGCDCDYGHIEYLPVQCTSCTLFDANGKPLIGDSQGARQKRIWNQARVSQSEYLITRAAWSVVGGRENFANTANGAQYPYVNWNQMSDRRQPHQQTAYHPSRGNSTRTTLTGIKPGACAPAGKGVDVKHDSYARYLARKKSRALKIKPADYNAEANFGNKTQPYNITINHGAQPSKTSSKSCFNCA